MASYTVTYELQLASAKSHQTHAGLMAILPGEYELAHGANKTWRPYCLLAVRAWGDAGCVLADIP